MHSPHELSFRLSNVDSVHITITPTQATAPVRACVLRPRLVDGTPWGPHHCISITNILCMIACIIINRDVTPCRSSRQSARRTRAVRR